MSTQFVHAGESLWIRPPDNFQLDSSSLPDNVWPAGESGPALAERDGKVKSVMSEFVEMLKDNAKVWAVCATADPDGINVWTYIDSRNEPDLMSVFDAEWRLRKAYPKIAFDFNTVSVPAGDEVFDEDNLDFLYRR